MACQCWTSDNTNWWLWTVFRVLSIEAYIEDSVLLQIPKPEKKRIYLCGDCRSEYLDGFIGTQLYSNFTPMLNVERRMGLSRTARNQARALFEEWKSKTIQLET